MCNQEETTLELQNTNKDNQLSDAQQTVHNAFDKFLEVFIKSRKSLIVEYKNGEGDYIFSVDDIKNCLEFLNDVTKLNPGDDKEGKDLKTAINRIEDNATKRKYYILLWHCYWIMYLMNNTSKTFLDNTCGLKVREKYPDAESGTPLFVEKEIAATDMAYSSGSIKAFVDILKLFKDLIGIEDIASKDVKCIKLQILKDENLTNNRAKNVLLYLCNPDKYPCIISQRHQNAIYKILGDFYEKEGDNNKFAKEEHVRTIENCLIKEFGCTLYDEKLKPFWDISSTNLSMDNEDKLSRDILLKYKKAIVLYGPPGTSKSYEARSLAKHLLRLDFLKGLRNKIKDASKAKDVSQSQYYKGVFEQFLSHFSNICDEQKENDTDRSDYKGIPHIHRLQLHPGYTYDDFIVGQTIKGNGVQIQNGYLMRLIDDINRDREANTTYANLPHILILDEINRVDISRVFGELFTAMEKDYRKTGVDLPVTESVNGKSLKLIVPEDLYIIGTMNMIDFSLEQVDFALRRRFAWIESNYDKNRLEEIIKEKKEKIGKNIKITDTDIQTFIQACTSLNDKISKEPSLGPAYQIGHAFFSEIVDIYDNVKSEGKQYPWEVAKKVLWSISVRPTLDAYCGSMETEQKKQFIEGCKNAFLPQVKDKVKDSKSKQTDVELSSENE